MIIPCRMVEAGGDQENVMFRTLGVTVKLCGGPVGAEKKECFTSLLDGLQICNSEHGMSLLLQTTKSL